MNIKGGKNTSTEMDWIVSEIYLFANWLCGQQRCRLSEFVNQTCTVSTHHSCSTLPPLLTACGSQACADIIFYHQNNCLIFPHGLRSHKDILKIKKYIHHSVREDQVIVLFAIFFLTFISYWGEPRRIHVKTLDCLLNKIQGQ